MKSYSFKKSFSQDINIGDRLFELAEICFPGISSATECGRKLGASWEAVSTPFIYFHNEVSISHVGVLEIPLQLMGKPVTVAGIHGVCTHPNFRRRGYYRQVMEEVLDYCESRYETLILTTPEPKFYTPFGFRFVPEHAFVSKSQSTGGMDGLRSLDLENPADRKLLQKLLEQRTPVSNIVGVVNEKAVFYFNEGNNPLQYIEDLDIILCMEIEDTTLKLFDIVGKNIDSLAKIIDRIPQPIDEVILYFSPDRLNTEADSFRHVLNGDSFLMVRGSFPAEEHKFMLPRSARC